MKIRRRDYTYLNSITDKKELFLTIRYLIKNDLYFLCKYILNYKDMETKTSIHYGLCEKLEDPNWIRQAIMMFRGSFCKSTALRSSSGRASAVESVCDRSEGVTAPAAITAATKVLRFSLAAFARSSAVLALSLPACTSTRATPERVD